MTRSTTNCVGTRSDIHIQYVTNIHIWPVSRWLTGRKVNMTWRIFMVSSTLQGVNVGFRGTVWPGKTYTKYRVPFTVVSMQYLPSYAMLTIPEHDSRQAHGCRPFALACVGGRLPCDCNHKCVGDDLTPTNHGGICQRLTAEVSRV